LTDLDVRAFLKEATTRSARLVLIAVHMVVLLLMVMLLLVIIGTLPAWPYSTKLGYYPSCVSGAILFGIAVLVVAADDGVDLL
jgi:hypothetical protein